MSASWAINGTSLAALGMEFVGGTFNTGSRSVMTLRKTGDFMAADVFAWGSPVTLTRDTVPYFQGKVNSLPHSASEDDESQEIEIVDAWQDLEDTIYMEEWPAGESGSVLLPVAILGRKASGAECTDAEQIVEAVNFAASAGVSIQMGSIPAGLPLWQSEVRNVSVAEVIRLSLRFHPDWVPWIDHGTMPPTLNFTSRAALGLRTIDIGEGDTSHVRIVRRDDLMPEAVRILYLNAVVVDGTTYRDWIEDHAPDGAPTEGPRVISNIIELAGGQMQFQKQRIKTRALPSDHGECRAWLKKKYPDLADIPDGAWTVRMISKELIPEPVEDEEADPINERAERLVATELDDLPNELVKGTIEDWMRKKVGQVKIGFIIKINPSAGAATRKKLAPFVAMPGLTVTATNAITKIYKGVTQWVAPEAAPVGIAQSVYNSLSAYQYEGSITTVMEDVSELRYHGTRLCIEGGRGEWGSMNAMVHSMSFDIATGMTTISVGPAPFLAAQDLLEMARLLRGRPVTWMSEDERTSNEMGATDDPGSKGDTVGGYERPETIVMYEAPPAPLRFGFGGLYKDEDDVWRVKIGQGCVLYHEMTNRSDFDNRKLQGQFVRGIFPTVENVRIDDPSEPGLELGGRDSASVWLVCRKEQCGASSNHHERLEITDRDEDPDIQSDEDAFQIVDFDVEEDDDGDKQAKEISKYLQSDLVQNYSCAKDNTSSDDYDGSDMDGSSDFVSSSGSFEESLNSGSSDDDSDDDPDNPCRITVTAGWAGAVVTCFPKKAGAGTAPIPAPFTFTIRVKFTFQQPWGGVVCEDYAYGASLSGGVIPGTSPVETEYKWRDGPGATDRELTWYVENPPACGSLQVTWRVKSFAPKRGPLDPPSDEVGCCDKSFGGTVTVIMRQYLTTGPWDKSKTKLPPVCGHTCSSAVISDGSGGEDSGA